MIRFYARHKRQVRIVATVLVVVGLIYLATKTQGTKKKLVHSQSYAGSAMGTAIKKTIFAEDEDLRLQAQKEIDICLQELEEQISVRIKDSEIALCNRNYMTNGLYPLSEQSLSYLQREMDIYKESNGAFNPCIRPLTALWGIEEGNTQIPSDEDIQKALDVINPVNIELQDTGIVFHQDGMAIDFGAVGKGIAADRILKLLPDTKVEGAVVSIGGTIAVYGDKGNDFLWNIAIQNPRDEEGQVMGILELEGGMVVSTSGDYEKYFEVDGKRYHHIFNPYTGYPAESGLISVTIISSDGFLSDAMSTACFVMGRKDGMEYAKKKKVEAVFVTEDKKVYITDGLKKKFYIKDKEYKLSKE